MYKICKEIDLLTRMDHPNIVKIHEFYIYTNDIFIVMEYLSGGELFKKISERKADLTASFVRDTMRDLLGAIAYMHKNNIGQAYSVRFKCLRLFRVKVLEAIFDFTNSW